MPIIGNINYNWWVIVVIITFLKSCLGPLFGPVSKIWHIYYKISRNVSGCYGELLLGVLLCRLHYTSQLMSVTNVFQERIAKAHGSQCGFCTPGIVMSMYALLRNNPSPRMADVEEAFHGTPRQWDMLLLISVKNYTLQKKRVFIFLFRKSVSLHRLQAHPGGVQDFYCGQTHVNSHNISLMLNWQCFFNVLNV